METCIADGVMVKFLTKHKAEVMSVCLTEFDEEVFVDGIREEGKEEGKKEGMIEGRLKERAESILEFLEDCGEIPEQLRALIREKG